MKENTPSPRRRRLQRGAALAALLAAGCGGAPPAPRPIEHVVIPVEDTTPHPEAKVEEKEPPPGSGPAKDFHFPKVIWSELPNGLKIATIPNHALPLVQIRAVVLGGKSADGERTGVTALTAQLLKDGGAGAMSSRDLVTKVESLGAKLSIDTDFDRTTLGLKVTRDHLGEALDLLGAVVGKPQLNPAEFEKLKKREMERTADLARTSGDWSASMILFRDLFTLPAEHHPYASYDATPSDIAKLTVNDCRALHRRLFVPKNTFLVVAGDTTPEAVKAAAEKAFGGLRGGEAPIVSFTDPMPPESLKITLVDRPKSSQSDIFAGVLGPERADKSWPAFSVANMVLGGDTSSRLFVDVREKQSLAYNTTSWLEELAHGPSLLVAYAGTQTAKTGLSLKSVLEQLDRIGQAAADDDEVNKAKRLLADELAFGIETIGSQANELARLKTLGLPDDYYDLYRKDVGEVTPAVALKAASESVRTGHVVVVVAGDAQAIGGMLSHFGEVKVLDPTKDFARIKTIPMNADAPLESERAEGR